jgi:UDP-N-acetylglucosamine 2-epimerase (non-hydrolysing)
LKKISFIFGTRPEAIKLCPLILLMRGLPDFEVQICVTGQHRELLDQALAVFEITPNVDLNLIQPNQSLAGLTATAVAAISSYLDTAHPDLVVVQGDTTTTFCAALAAFYQRIPVAHVEAGLRTGNRFSPYPEEINRCLTTQLADYHFAPTELAKANLLREGVSESRIYVTGNTVVDALNIALRKAASAQPIPGLPAELMNGNGSRRLVLITGHRRESFGPAFESICKAIGTLASEFPKTAFVYPVHLNPNVRKPVFDLLGSVANVFLLEPLGYLDFIALANRSKFIMTDSGGIQEEAPTLRKQVLLMRDTTERPEGVEAGTATLVGTDMHKIVSEARKLLADDHATTQATGPNPFGDGRASERILQIIRNELGH